MSTDKILHRSGMSLVELLVIVAIIGVLAVTVLPNVSNSLDSRRSREAVRMLTSAIAKMHSRAIGRREWAGFQLAASGSQSFAALEIVPVEVPSVFYGDAVPSSMTLGSTGGAGRLATPSPGALVDSVPKGLVSAGDLIRFAGRDPYFEISSVGVTEVGIRMRGQNAGAAFAENAGYEPHNTPWPAAGVELPFEVLRQPQRAGARFALPQGQAIDLLWSGYGPPEEGGTYTRFKDAGKDISILFDGSGRLRQIVRRRLVVVAGVTQEVVSRESLTAPLYLLVGRADRCSGNDKAYDTFDPADDSSGTNWQYPDSYWIAIDPLSGVVRTAECLARNSGVVTTGEKGVLVSQQWIRDSLLSAGG